MSKIRYNKSKTYLLPLLAQVIDMDIKFFNHLRNTYIGDVNGLYKDCLIVLHDFSFKNPEFTKYENRITSNPYFVDLVDINNQVLYIFKFPEEYLTEYKLFQQGKYSLYGDDAKEVILNFYGDIYTGNLNAVKFLLTLKQVLYRDNKLKQELEKKLGVSLPAQAELSDIADMEAETFDATNIEQ